MAQGLYLSQKMSQTMVLAPQLQQSLALLQAPILELRAQVEAEQIDPTEPPILELRAQVEAELEQNPVLEEAATGEMEPVEKGAKEKKEVAEQIDPTEPPADVTFDPATEKESSEPVDDFQAEFEKLTQLDQEWRDVDMATPNIPQQRGIGLADMLERHMTQPQVSPDAVPASQALQLRANPAQVMPPILRSMVSRRAWPTTTARASSRSSSRRASRTCS